ncbi:MAG: riboflavin synthase [Actinobacteria bacterium]|nr:riboflavin synthase [Actinomycetota bacterium]
MFTGIVEEKGSVAGFPSGGKLKVSASKVLEGTGIGDSIAVSGVCLTVTELPGDAFVVDVMPETLIRSTLGGMRPGSRVNLERALQVGARLGGHIVNGHVDGVGTVRERRLRENAVFFTVDAPREICSYTVEKGSIAIDGISLTVVEAHESWFSVSIIPHTLEETTLMEAQPGVKVNLEVDIIAKYVERLISRDGGNLEDLLRRNEYFSLDEGI